MEIKVTFQTTYRSRTDNEIPYAKCSPERENAVTERAAVPSVDSKFG